MKVQSSRLVPADSARDGALAAEARSRAVIPTPRWRAARASAGDMPADPSAFRCCACQPAGSPARRARPPQRRRRRCRAGWAGTPAAAARMNLKAVAGVWLQSCAAPPAGVPSNLWWYAGLQPERPRSWDRGAEGGLGWRSLRLSRRGGLTACGLQWIRLVLGLLFPHAWRTAVTCVREVVIAVAG